MSQLNRNHLFKNYSVRQATIKSDAHGVHITNIYETDRKNESEINLHGFKSLTVGGVIAIICRTSCPRILNLGLISPIESAQIVVGLKAELLGFDSHGKNKPRYKPGLYGNIHSICGYIC